MKITHMGVAFHGITWMEEGQRGIATFLVAPPPRPISSKDRARSESAGAHDVGGKREDYDDTGEKRKRRSVSITPAPQDRDADVIDVDQGQLAGDNDSSYSFTCPRCKKKQSLPRKTVAECRSVSGENTDLASELLGSALAAMKLEHDDFHFAQDLARENRPIITNTASGSGSPKRPVKKQKKGAQSSKPAGIAQFFAQKGKT